MSGGLGNVFVTGANRGIGLGFVRALCQNGASRVFAACRNPDKAAELKSLASSNDKISIMKLEITNDEEISAIVEAVSAATNGEGIQLLLNNAGVWNASPLEQLQRNELMECLNCNVASVAMLLKQFTNILRPRPNPNHGSNIFSRCGVICNISSDSGSLAQTFDSSHIAYQTSKAALNMLTKAASFDLFNNHQIVSFLIHPGFVKTDMAQTAVAAVGCSPDLTVEESVAAMVEVIMAATEETNGRFMDWKGQEMPW